MAVSNKNLVSWDVMLGTFARGIKVSAVPGMKLRRWTVLKGTTPAMPCPLMHWHRAVVQQSSPAVLPFSSDNKDQLTHSCGQDAGVTNHVIFALDKETDDWCRKHELNSHIMDVEAFKVSRCAPPAGFAGFSSTPGLEYCVHAHAA